MIPIPILFQAYARGAAGIPSTASPLIVPPIEQYSHTISATGGFESCAVDFSGTLDDALFWLNNLGATVVCYGPEMTVIWEGLISTVSVQLGQEKIDLSLDDMANAIAVRYQPGVGQNATTAFVTDSASIAAYGRKELVYSGSGMDSAAAAVLQNTLLAARSNPIPRRSSSIAVGSGRDEISISLMCTGWYYTLEWLTTSNSTTSVLGTTTQVGALLATAAATNAFISTSTLDIQSSALSDTQYIEANTPIRAKIERLLSLGNSSGQRIAYGVYEAQTFKANTWAAADPTNITYRRYLADDLMYNAMGARVDFWDVRPNANYQVVELLDAGPISTVDGVATYYVERVTCSVDSNGASVKLEPARSSELDVLLARIRN